MKGLGILAIVLSTPLAAPANDPVTRQQIEADLRIHVEFKGDKTMQAGTLPLVSATLVNTSKKVTHRVIKPGDGSDVGWREPHVYWTATIDRGDGKWVDVPKADYGRCGLFGGDWPKSAIRLAPGEKIPLNQEPLLEFQQAGRVRLRAHYSYEEGRGKLSRSRVAPERLDVLIGVPAFEIVSEPVEFTVIRPLDVRVKVKRPLRAQQPIRLSELLEITLVNQSMEAIECSSPTLHAEARLDLQIRGEYGGWRPRLSEQRSAYGIRRTLKAGEALPLLGATEFANGLDGTWEYPEAGKVLLRAAYSTSARASIQSDWVEVRVER
jgi:hypothetical protein